MHAHVVVGVDEDSNRTVEVHNMDQTAVGYDYFYSDAVVDSTPQPWLYALRVRIVPPLVPALRCN